MQTSGPGSSGQPYAAARHHWMNWVARHALMQPESVAFRYLGADTTWRALHERSTALAAALALTRAVAAGGGIDLVVAMDTATEGEVTGYADLVAEPVGDWSMGDLPEDTTALILYTSGTTGHPKGAMLTHANMALQALTCIRAFWSTPEDVSLMAAPAFHVAAIGAVAPNLLVGLRTVIHPLREFNPSELIDTWERERVTSVFLVPAQWQAVCADPSLPGRDLALRMISWGAAPATDTLLRRMAECFPGAKNVAVFGQTEMSPITCVLEGDEAIARLGSVGRVIPTVSAMVVDADMVPVRIGEVGEIVYRGPTLMKGYWNDPDATAAAFDGGWFHSGDLVRQDADGYVWVIDRTKDMIISGGENIYSAEVENAVAGHPSVAEVAVTGRSDERWGEVPVATVALRPGAPDLTLEELRGFLQDRLAAYKHPRALVVVDALPRNAAGKVLKPRLRQEQPST